MLLLPPLNILSIRILALVFFAGLSEARSQTPTPSLPPSVVYSVSNSAAIKQYRADPAVVRAMVDRLILAVTGESSVAKAWSTLVTPADKVGIKISAAGGELFTTHREVVNAIVDGLVAAGIPRRSIIVWDRQLSGIREAGYRVGSEGYQLKSIEPRDGYDSKAVFSAPFLGTLIWGDLLYVPRWGENPLRTETENTSHISHFARIVSSEVTKIINVPVMSDSAAIGLAGCLYNVTLPNIDNWRRFMQHGLPGGAGLAQIYSDPMIRPKVVVNIMDGLIAGYAAGPQSHPNYALHHATLLASKDPVAIDAIALKRIEQWRAEAKLPPIGELAAHVPIAGAMGLGNADDARIQVRKLDR